MQIMISSFWLKSKIWEWKLRDSGTYKHDNKPSSSIQGETFIDQLSALFVLASQDCAPGHEVDNW